MVKWVLKNRGKVKVTATAIKKQFPRLRKLGDDAIYARLDDADLSWLRRRGKTMITKQYLQQRVQYCEAVKRKKDSTLERWAYTDGTVYYLDRDESEAQQSKRRCLGTHVWRRSDNKDALYEDCIGPSLYSKGQGKPVKVWGMLACGVIHIHILDEGETMNTMLYTELIEDKFDDWKGNCDQLVCDFERCIRTADAVHALGKVDLKLVEGYPKNSQDFNAMENAWKILKDKLDETMPVKLELREDFIKRLKKAVKWANTHRSEQLWKLSTNQKERAEDCLAQEPPGGRTKW